MKDITNARGLRDLRTASSAHIHCRPHPKGTTHLDLFLLNKEKERLETKQMMLGHQQRVIRERVADIDKAMAKLGRKNEPECMTITGDNRDNPDRNDKNPVEGKWKKMSLRY
jgi:DNA topoisomerase VI subunit B